jgi:hypothetical protein
MAGTLKDIYRDASGFFYTLKDSWASDLIGYTGRVTYIW